MQLPTRVRAACRVTSQCSPGALSNTCQVQAHKALAAYALGVTFVRAEIGAVRHGLLVLLFATFTPLGMVGELAG